MYVFLNIYTYLHGNMHAKLVYVWLHTYILFHACLHVYKHRLHAYLGTWIDLSTDSDVCPSTHTYIHTYMVIYTCIFIQVCLSLSVCLSVSLYIYMLQALKLGYKRNIMAHAWWGKGDRSGMLADAQVSWHDSLHMCKGFPTQSAEADDCDVIWWHHWCLCMYIGGRNKKEVCMRPGGLV